MLQTSIHSSTLEAENMICLEAKLPLCIDLVEFSVMNLLIPRADLILCSRILCFMLCVVGHQLRPHHDWWAHQSKASNFDLQVEVCHSFFQDSRMIRVLCKETGEGSSHAILHCEYRFER